MLREQFFEGVCVAAVESRERLCEAVGTVAHLRHDTPIPGNGSKLFDSDVMILEDVGGSIRITPLRASSGGVALIRLEVRVGDRTWATDDPGLEPNDLRALGRWLRTLSKGRTAKELVFLEPNLRFECVRSGQLSHVRVWFEGEARPEWAPYETWDEEDLWLDIEVSGARLASAAEALIDELNRAEA